MNNNDKEKLNPELLETVKEEAAWLRNDIKSKGIDEKIKILLLSLSDEELVSRVNRAEDELILAKLENRVQSSVENLKRYSMNDVRDSILKRKKI